MQSAQPVDEDISGTAMYAWSDWEPPRAPAAASSAIRHVLVELARPGATVLVAGPHDERLLRALLAAGATVTCLLRGIVDAKRLREDLPQVRVVCGSPFGLDPAARFDVVLAAAGIERLASTEGPPLTWASAFDVLCGVLADGGVLALAQGNDLSLNRLAELDPAGRHAMEPDRDFLSAVGSQSPASAAALRERFTAAGLSVAGGYALYPVLEAPTVLIGHSLTTAPSSRLRAPLEVLLRRAFTDAYTGVPVLFDPRPQAAAAVRAAAEETLASGWLVVGRRTSAGESGVAGAAVAGSAIAERNLVVADPRNGRAAALTLLGGEVGGEVVVEELDQGAPTGEREGLLAVADPWHDRAWSGEIVEERLLRLCAAGDLSAVREQLLRYVEWIAARAVEGAVAGPAALATFATLLDDGADLRLAEARWEPAEPLSVHVVLTRACWSLAVDLACGNRAHPWQLNTSVTDITTTLLAMVGQSLSAATLNTIIELQVSIDTVELDLPLGAREARRRQLTDLRVATAPPGVEGYRELVEALWRGRLEFGHLLLKTDWTERIIRSRDKQVSDMDWEVQLARRTWFGKFLGLGRLMYRTMRRDARRFLRRARRSRIDVQP